MHSPAKEADGYRRRTPAALRAAEAESAGEIFADFARAAARFAGEMSLVEGAATTAALEAGLIGQILIDLDQLLEKFDVGQEDVAHYGQSEVLGNRRLPQ